MNKQKYRIKKITLYNGEIYYLLQRYTRLLWIGPKIWETYHEVYDSCWQFHTGWTYFQSLGTAIETEVDAISILNNIEKEDDRNIKDEEVIDLNSDLRVELLTQTKPLDPNFSKTVDDNFDNMI